MIQLAAFNEIHQATTYTLAVSNFYLVNTAVNLFRIYQLPIVQLGKVHSNECNIDRSNGYSLLSNNYRVRSQNS